MNVPLAKKLFSRFLAIAGALLVMVGCDRIVNTNYYSTTSAGRVETGISMVVIGGIMMIAWGMRARR